MPSESASPSGRITAAFESLTQSAKALNEASGEVARPIATLDRALQRLNIGVACWTKISKGENQFGDYWSREVGYARVKNEWGLAIREVEGSETHPDEEKEELWPFNEAPHHLRVKAIGHLPELIEAMVEATNATAKRLRDTAVPARELSEAVNALLTAKKK